MLRFVRYLPSNIILVLTASICFSLGVYAFLPCFMGPLAVILLAIALVRWSRRPLKQGGCPFCSYDLTGNVTGKCPECGEVIDASDVKRIAVHRRFWKRTLPAICIILMIGLLWLVSGGVFVNSHRYYVGSTRLSVTPGIDLRIWVNTHAKTTGCPLLLMVQKDHPPYSISLSAFDRNEETCIALHIEKLQVEYLSSDREHVVQPHDQLSIPFGVRVSTNSTSRGVVRNRYLDAGHTFESVVSNPMDFRLIIAGWIEHEDGRIVEFESSPQFTISRRWAFTSGWRALLDSV